MQKVEVPTFLDNPHMKVVRLSALRTSYIYPPGNIRGIHVYYRLSRPQDQGRAGRITPTKNSSGTIGNRNRYLPACINQLRHRVPLYYVVF